MEEFSIFSWNVLADCFAMDGKFSLDHVSPSNLNWTTRSQRILGMIHAASPDIICLQEVMHAAFDGDFQPALEAKGYECLMQRGKWKEGSFPTGNATFWRKSKLRLVWEQARSRVHSAVLEDPHKRKLALLNCHLEGEPSKIVARVTQLQNSLQMLGQQTHNAVVVVGDFNCELRSSACASYLAFGSVLPGVVEWGREVPTTAIAPHAYTLTTAYTPNKGDFSFTVSGHRGFYGMLDQLWYSQPSLRLIEARPMFTSPAQRAEILAHGLPSASNPSDHLPIGALFAWNQQLSVFGPVMKSAPSFDPLQEAALLLENCPWTEAQRLEWIEVNPQQVTSKKPSAEQIAALKALSARKQKLLSELNDDAQQILKRVVILQKQAAKQVAPSNDENKTANTTTTVNGGANTAQVSKTLPLSLASFADSSSPTNSSSPDTDKT